MTSNKATLKDEDGSSSDWLELHNAGTTPLSLAVRGGSDWVASFTWRGAGRGGGFVLLSCQNLAHGVCRDCHPSL